MPSDPPWRDRETLHELYYGEDLTQQEMADHLDCSLATIRRWMDRLDVRTRVKPWAQMRTTEDKGYETWYDSGTRVYVHRLLAVSEYGFDQVTGMRIHHKDEIPWDNRPENIEPLERSEHRGKHAKRPEKERKALAYAWEMTDMSSHELADVTPYSQASVVRIHGEYFSES